MQRTRFRLSRCNKQFNCYDCTKTVFEGDQMAWDNRRNIRICIPCFDRLTDMLEASDGLESGASKRDKVYWDSTMLPTRPWTLGNFDINNWPPDIQDEYIILSSGIGQYTKGLIAAITKQGAADLVKG